MEYIKNKFLTENTFFETEVNNIKDILDKMTDICENQSLLNKNTLILLNDFLIKHKNYISNDFLKISKSEIV